MTGQRAAAIKLARLFGSSVVDQAMLSAANFAVGLLLIRYAPETQYGYYILAFNTMMLLTTLQGTFIGTPMVIRLPSLDEAARRQWMGSLLKDQQRWSLAGAGLSLVVTAVAWWQGALDRESLLVVLAGLSLVLAALYREYFRGILLMYRRPHEVLAADALYVVGLVIGVIVAVQIPAAAATALFASAVSAVICARWLRRRLGDEVAPEAMPGRLREIARMGFWAASGGVIYWLFNQGYSLLAAATLDIGAVAALAASRLILMPVNLLSAGVQKQLTPIASGWLYELGPSATLKRLLLFSAGMGVLTLFYIGCVWFMRDWIFLDLMRKDFEQRDTLLMLWCALFLLMVMREPPSLLPVLRQRFRLLTGVNLVCALLALGTSYLGMLSMGPMGAVVGVLVGEVCSFTAMLYLAFRETRGDRAGKGGTV